MHYFEQAPEWHKDSTQYKLINVMWGRLFRNEASMDISYRRSDDAGDGFISYTEMRRVHPTLPEIIESIFDKQSENPDDEKIDVATEIGLRCAYIFGSYVDLKTPEFPFCNPLSVQRQEDGSYMLDGGSFAVSPEGELMIAPGLLKFARMVNAATIDSVWPGGAAKIDAMQSLDYSPEDIIKHLVQENVAVSRECYLPSSDYS